MTDKSPQHDMRETNRTDETRAAEKKAGEAPFAAAETRPVEPPGDTNSGTNA